MYEQEPSPSPGHGTDEHAFPDIGARLEDSSLEVFGFRTHPARQQSRSCLGLAQPGRVQKSEVEFVTMMTFDSIQSVIDFQGEDYERCYVPDVAQAVLERWDLTAAHFEVQDHELP